MGYAGRMRFFDRIRRMVPGLESSSFLFRRARTGSAFRKGLARTKFLPVLLFSYGGPSRRFCSGRFAAVLRSFSDFSGKGKSGPAAVVNSSILGGSSSAFPHAGMCVLCRRKSVLARPGDHSIFFGNFFSFFSIVFLFHHLKNAETHVFSCKGHSHTLTERPVHPPADPPRFTEKRNLQL